MVMGYQGHAGGWRGERLVHHPAPALASVPYSSADHGRAVMGLKDAGPSRKLRPQSLSPWLMPQL